MPKYYVESGRIRLVLTADDAEQAAVKRISMVLREAGRGLLAACGGSDSGCRSDGVHAGRRDPGE